MKIQPINNTIYANRVKQSEEPKNPTFEGKIQIQTAKTLDNKLMTAMTKLNLTNVSLRRFMPHLDASEPKGKYSRIIMEKIKATEERIRNIEEAIATGVKPARVREAENDISFYNSWNDSSEESYYRKKADKEGKAAKAKQNWFGKTFNSKYSDAYDEAMKPYWDKHYRYCRIRNDISNLRNIVADYEKSSNMQLEMLASLRREKAAYDAQLTSAGLTDAIGRTMMSEGGINERIAGYEDVKVKIQKEFVGPLCGTTEIENAKLPDGKAYTGDKNVVPVPAAVVLYGATGVGKTEMLRGIEEQCAQSANVLHFPPETTIEGFRDTMKEYLARARAEHGNSHKRTILLIDEAEKFLCMTEGKAQKLLSGLEVDDFEVLTRYGSEDKDNIDYLKSLLDRISELPDGKDSTKSATTLFITTNYPHLIDQDLMRRKGKFTPIAVPPASNSDLREVIRHYFKLNSEMLEMIKMLSKNDNFQEILNGQVRLTAKARQVLMDKKENGTLDGMSINYELTDWPNMERFLKFANPSQKRGAYSNVEWKYIVNEAFDRYLENPSIPMYKHFFEVQSETVRDITPRRYANFRAIFSMVNDKIEKGEMDEADQNFDNLINQYQHGELDAETEMGVEKRMEEIQEQFEVLTKKKKSGVLTEGEQMQYDLYKRWTDAWEV